MSTILTPYSQRMYGRRIKKWGFEKNLTGSRIARLFRAGTVQDGVRKAIDMARVDRYLKRKRSNTGLSNDSSPSRKAAGSSPNPMDGPPADRDTSDDSSPDGNGSCGELLGDGSCVEHLGNEIIELPAGCPYSARSWEKFRIHVHDS